ncbi:MAG: LysR family transcriptional regulator [Betaproteobacteria bacterium]
MDRLEAMEMFVRIVETGSFSVVAREMGKTQPTISKQVTALEQRLKTRLLNRSTRSISLTELGAAFYERCKAIIDEVQDAESMLGDAQSSLSGILSVNSSIALGQILLMPLLLKFQQQHPGLEIDLSLSDRYIDLVEQGVDVAVRVGNRADANLISRLLGATQRLLVATPAYLQAHGIPQTPADLARHNCLQYAYLSTGSEWLFMGVDGEIRVRVSGNFKANNGHAIREALLAGVGVALTPDWLIHAQIAQGELVVLLPEFAPPPWEINAVYPAGRHLSSKVGAVLELLQHEFRAIPAFADTR